MNVPSLLLTFWCVFFCMFIPKKWDQTFATCSLKIYIGYLSISLNINQVLHFNASMVLHLWMNHGLFIPYRWVFYRPPIFGHLGCFPLPIITKMLQWSLCIPMVLSVDKCIKMEYQYRACYTLTNCHSERLPLFIFHQFYMSVHFSTP